MGGKPSGQSIERDLAPVGERVDAHDADRAGPGRDLVGDPHVKVGDVPQLHLARRVEVRGGQGFECGRHRIVHRRGRLEVEGGRCACCARALPGGIDPESYMAVGVVFDDPRCVSGGDRGVIVGVDGRTETLLAHASAYVSAGRLAEAEGAYNAILQAHPDEHRAHLGLADCVSARGLSDWAVDHLVEHARAYAERESMRSAFALMTKALAIAPGRLDLHIDVAEFEALDGRAEMAALRLENLARTYVASGQEEEAELVLDAAMAFRSMPESEDFDEPEPAPFINPHTGVSTPAPRPAVSPESSTLRVTATPPPPPPQSRVTSAPRVGTPTPPTSMVRPSPLAAAPPPPPPSKKPSTRVLATPPQQPPKKKRASRGRASGAAPKWRPSTVVNDPPPRRVKKKKPAPSVEIQSTARMAIRKPPRPRKAAVPVATYPTKRPSIMAAPSPKSGGKKLDKLPPLRPSLAARLRATSAGAPPPAEEDRTATWRAAT